jgi:hypothetical protein
LDNKIKHLIILLYMDKDEHYKITPAEEEYWAKRRFKWSEWGSPVGLGLAWTLLVVPLGLFLYLLHLAGFLR